MDSRLLRLSPFRLVRYEVPCAVSVQGGEARPEGHRQRSSDRWLVFALASTVVVLFGGSALLFGLFLSSGPSADASMAALPADESLTVVIGRAPGGATQWAMYTQALRAMEEASGIPVRTRYIARRYKVFEVLRTEDVDVAFVSVSEYLRLREHGGYEILASPVIKGQSMEAGVVLVETNSAMTTFEELRGASIALSSGSSLGGYGYLFWLMDQSGEDAETYFSSLVFNGSHAEAIERLISGNVDAAVVGRSELAGWPEERFRVVSESPEFGMRPVVVRADLDARIKNRLLAALLQLGSDTEESGEYPTVEGFRLPSPEDYAFAETLLEYTAPTMTDDSWDQP